MTKVGKYFEDPKDRSTKLKKKNYKKTIEKQNGQAEIREYYQTDKIKWMSTRDRWDGIKTIGCVVKTINREEKTVTETRYYISSLKPDIELFSKAVRQH